MKAPAPQHLLFGMLPYRRATRRACRVRLLCWGDVALFHVRFNDLSPHPTPPHPTHPLPFLLGPPLPLQELPETWDEYKALVGRWLPAGIYDTKHISGGAGGVLTRTPGVALHLACRHGGLAA